MDLDGVGREVWALVAENKIPEGACPEKSLSKENNAMKAEIKNLSIDTIILSFIAISITIWNVSTFHPFQSISKINDGIVLGFPETLKDLVLIELYFLTKMSFKKEMTYLYHYRNQQTDLAIKQGS